MADLRDYTKKNTIFSGTDGVRLPTGNSAQRTASSNVNATLRYNTDINGMEVYSPTGWTPLAAPPTITTVTPSSFNGASGSEFVIQGSNFTTDAQVFFVTTNGTALLAGSVTYYNTTELRATTPRNILVQEEPISVRVVQQSGTTNKLNCIDAGGLPTWVTTAGNLGSIFGANTVNVYVTATDPEGTVVSYEISSGSLPGGLQLSANGLIQGLANSVVANTTYNFTIKASDTATNNTDRSFSYNILNRAPVINTASGLIATFYSGNAVPSTTISAYDPDDGTITFTAPTGNIVNTTVGSANGVIVGTPIVVTTNTTYTIGITATDEGGLTASNTYTFNILNRPPVWNTAASLPSIDDQYSNSIIINAYDPDGGSVTYTLSSGSLPSGLSLNTSNGAIIGTAPTVTSNTTSTFTVTVTDPGNDSNTRTFTLVVTEPVDPYFANNVLLIHSDANTIIKDVSSNNLSLTVYGDARSTAFSPYNTSWSNYFDGSTVLEFPPSANTAYGTGPYTVEGWVYLNSYSTGSGYSPLFYSQAVSGSNYFIFGIDASGYLSHAAGHTAFSLTDTTTKIPLKTWTHVAVCRSGTGTNLTKLFVNGNIVASGTNTVDLNDTTSCKVGLGGYTHSNILDLNGYMSNIRVTKSGLYTTNFTPSTTPLTAIANTVLLTCNSNRLGDRSNSNGVVSVTRGTPKVVGLSPFTENDNITGSIYLDGTGDYVKWTPRESFGSSDFTAECWFYYTGNNSSEYDLFSLNANESTSFSPARLTINSNKLRVLMSYSGSAWDVNLSNYSYTLYPYTWYHVSLNRVGSTGTLYLNGERQGASFTISGSLLNQTSSAIGYNNYTPGVLYTPGYISDFRLVIGNAVYTGNTSVPISPLSNVANTKILTFQNRIPHNNKNALDVASRHLMKTEGLTSVGSFSPFSAEEGKWSVYYAGNGYISAGSNSAFALGTSDFQIDMWVNMTAYPSTYGALFSTRTGSAGMDIQLLNNSGTVQLMIGNPSGAIISANNVLPLNAWALITAVRSSGTFYLFVNGSLVASGASSQNFTDNGSYIGAGVSGNNPFTGYISNFRLIKGNALNTSTFTPSTQPLTALANTIILACQSGMQIDKSTANNGGAWNLTISGSARTLPYSPFAPSASYDANTKGGSIYFNGVDDEINFVTNEGSNRAIYGAQQNSSSTIYTWTMECWAYPTSTSFSIIQRASNTVGAYEWYWYNDSSSGSGLFFHYRRYGYSDDIKYSNTPLKSNSWNYIVLQHNGNDVYDFYVNGNRIRAGSGNSYGNVNLIEANDITRIGASTTGVGSPTGGMWYMSDFRFTPRPLYTDSTMTIPTSPLTLLPNTSVLISGNTFAFHDSTAKNNIVTVGDIKSNNSVFKHDGGALTFDGTGDYAYVPSIAPNPLFNFGTQDFTVEMWIYPKSAAAQSCLVDFRASDTSGQGFALNITTSSTLMYYMTASRITSSTITLNTWTHVAITRASGVVRMFVNGTVQGTTYTDTTSHVAQANRPIFGVVNDLTQPYNGLIDEIRITRGYARYINSFTAPTKSFPNK